MPFLLVSPSAEFSAMGEVSVAIETENPFALFWNPAFIGSQSLKNVSAIGFSTNKYNPENFFGKLPYTSRVFVSGINLNDYFQLPIGLGFGLAYSNISNNLGNFVETAGDSPDLIRVFEGKETVDQYSLGISADHRWFKFSAGFTYKDIVSSLAPFDVQALGIDGIARVGATDIGLLLQIPVQNIIPEVAEVKGFEYAGFSPFLNLSAGYSQCNIGDRVTYIDPDQADPLPRTAREGIAVNVGLTRQIAEDTWMPLSFRWSVDVSDLLIKRWNEEYRFDSIGQYYERVREAGWEYTEGAGNIHWVNDVLLGQTNDALERRKGWEVNILEIFSYRAGRIEDHSGNRFLKTNGYGLRLRGVFKVIDVLTGEEIQNSYIRWIFNHVDFVYNHARNSESNLIERDRVYNEFLFSIMHW